MTRPRGPERSSERMALERHVIQVQRTLRTCEGCGLCCTDIHNGVKVLPVEARRIARYLDSLPLQRRSKLLAEVTAAIARYGLGSDAGKVRYTCPFLDRHRACTLPLRVKPTACLSFNPLDLDRCGQEPGWYFPTHDRETTANRRAGMEPRETPLPVAVLAALATRTGETAESLNERQGSGTSSRRRTTRARKRQRRGWREGGAR